ncbi:MAG TPA: AMP-binding protein [Candidatus Acidoferrales bacterium]|nr:AMP-binding protein [Candidatus Acidoferrales bacterium]
MPRSLAPYPARTLLSYLAEAAFQRPHHPALLFKGNVITCGQLEQLSDALAAALAALGVVKGDRIGLILPSCPQFVIGLFGAWKAGAVAAPLSPLYTPHELEEALNRLRVETVVVWTRGYSSLKAIQPKTTLRRIVATSIKEYLPPASRLMYTLAFEQSRGDRASLVEGDYRLQELLGEYSSRQPKAAQANAGDPAVILMSGGTTGTPKGVIGLHGGLVAAGLQGRAWLSPVLSEWSDVNLLPLPLFHVLGMGVLAGSVVGHNPLCLVPDPRDLTDLLHTIEIVRPSLLYGVPALFVALLNRTDVAQGQINLRSIKLCFSGAAPLLAETKSRFEALTGGRIVEGYSCTEAMMACTVQPVLGIHKVGSVGLPLPDVSVRVIDAGGGDAGPGGVGDVLISAPQVSPGYWENEVETAGAFSSDANGHRWLTTGDVGYLDEDGYLFLVDRKKDLIKTSGYQVWPREIEEVIASHPAVSQVAVAGVPDSQKGEVPQAWVVLRQGTQAGEQEIRAYCRERLAPYKVPARVVLVESLPVTMAGKILKRKLVAHPTPSRTSEET